MLQTKMCMHCYVTGKVQGVWFRANTQKEAKKLGITGWVKNLPDGRVEVFACGDKTQLAQFYHWLQKGPPLAHVKTVERRDLPWQLMKEFVIE